MLDTDVAAGRVARMWKKVAVALEKAAISAAERGMKDSAVAFAEAADACFWQATGEMDAPSVKDIMGRKA